MPESTRASPSVLVLYRAVPGPISPSRAFLRAAKFSDWGAPDKLRLFAKYVTNTCQGSE